MAHHVQGGTARDAEANATESGPLVYSRCSFERITHAVGELYGDHDVDIDDDRDSGIARAQRSHGKADPRIALGCCMTSARALDERGFDDPDRVGVCGARGIIAQPVCWPDFIDRHDAIRQLANRYTEQLTRLTRVKNDPDVERRERRSCMYLASRAR